MRTGTAPMEELLIRQHLREMMIPLDAVFGLIRQQNWTTKPTTKLMKYTMHKMYDT